MSAAELLQQSIDTHDLNDAGLLAAQAQAKATIELTEELRTANLIAVLAVPLDSWRFLGHAGFHAQPVADALVPRLGITPVVP